MSVAPKAKPIKGHKALGTNSFVGGATWMNEAGHEGAILPRGTKILSNNKMNNLENSSGITMNVPINITIEGNADKNTMKNAINSAMPSIKQQIEAYFRQKQRLGVAFA